MPTSRAPDISSRSCSRRTRAQRSRRPPAAPATPSPTLRSPRDHAGGQSDFKPRWFNRAPQMSREMRCSCWYTCSPEPPPPTHTHRPPAAVPLPQSVGAHTLEALALCGCGAKRCALPSRVKGELEVDPNISSLRYGNHTSLAAVESVHHRDHDGVQQQRGRHQGLSVRHPLKRNCHVTKSCRVCQHH